MKDLPIRNKQQEDPICNQQSAMKWGGNTQTLTDTTV
jgi:hypothetical protein